MKTELDLIKPKFIVDPSINLEEDIKTLIEDFKIKILSYPEEEQVLDNLFKLMIKYFSKDLTKDILERTIDKEKIRHLYLSLLLDSDDSK